MGSGKFGFQVKKDKVNMVATKTEISVKEKCQKIQKKLKKTENKKTEDNTKEKPIWWNQCNSCKLIHDIFCGIMLFVVNIQDFIQNL